MITFLTHEYMKLNEDDVSWLMHSSLDLYFKLLSIFQEVH